jgi:hypothetical protein
MLTEAEKKWLEERKPPTQKPWTTTADDNFCRTCKKYNIDCVPWFRNTVDCPTDQGGHFRDAAEFEARVAAKLSIREDRLTPCILDPNPETHGECKQWHFYWRNSYAVYCGCAACRLKYARLAVEEEMKK